MKEKDITPEVIRLSKEIAKHWRMKFYRGCWSIDVDIITLWVHRESQDLPEECVPIPSISDCLEKLRELGYKYLIEYDYNGPWIRVYGGKEKYRSFEKDHQCEHEALLSALLEVLKSEVENE